MENGSSPPVRGTQPGGGWSPALPRFIPACAGNTAVHEGDGYLAGSVRGTPKFCRATVHPRLCGEHSVINPALCLQPVHPRLCGEHLGSNSRRHEHSRFIPACAGNTPWKNKALIIDRLHPRLLRRHICSSGVGILGRFIPACAGNTNGRRERKTKRRFIPACGEQLQGDHRFIPACAGNTCAYRRPSCRNAVGGEHGSSPPVRGTRLVIGRRGLANAGSSPPVRGTLGASSSMRSSCGSSPPVRGTPLAAQDQVTKNRSSPPVRGTPIRTWRNERAQRFIPACAGNTLSPT